MTTARLNMSTEPISVLGFHHATAIAGDAQTNVNFYAGVLGLRLVKRSVNQDAPNVYHLFYADAEGTPGTDITFFPWGIVAPFQQGTGVIWEQGFCVPPASLDYWRQRLESYRVAVESGVEWGVPLLRFRDPDGMRLALIASDTPRPFTPWDGSPVPPEHQIRGLFTAQIGVAGLGATERVLTEILGFMPVGQADSVYRFQVGSPGAMGFGYLEVCVRPDSPRGRWGRGGMHHLAWRVRDEAHLNQLRERIESLGLQPTPVIDRFWFRSVYFREPGGVLFELATDGPGFGIDEDRAHLSERLVLPPWLEPRRAEIEAALPPIVYPPANPELPEML